MYISIKDILILNSRMQGDSGELYDPWASQGVFKGGGAGGCVSDIFMRS